MQKRSTGVSLLVPNAKARAAYRTGMLSLPIFRRELFTTRTCGDRQSSLGIVLWALPRQLLAAHLLLVARLPPTASVSRPAFSPALLQFLRLLISGLPFSPAAMPLTRQQ
jgi:hypothetical protein